MLTSRQSHGEHFITIGHAQAWALLAAYEARRLFFTRAAMSCSRCVRLVGMMGLNRLDDESGGDRIASTLQPPTDWTELEERRRVYWGAFCVDSHASISTGWPTLINANDVSGYNLHYPSLPHSVRGFCPHIDCRRRHICLARKMRSLEAHHRRLARSTTSFLGRRTRRFPAPSWCAISSITSCSMCS